MNKVQLANPYNPAKNYKVAHWFATPKFDGVRAVFIPDRGFFTRNDKPVSGLDSMASVLQEFCTERGLSFVDGELVLAGGSFQASQSAILAAQHDEKSNIEFHVFAVGGSFKDTHEMLQELPDFPDARIFRVQSETIPNTFEAVDEACRKFTAQGYEGVVLRHPDIPYYEGRSNHLLKYKFFKEADLLIVGIIDGEGRLAGTIGSLVVEGTIGGLLVRSCVGTGLTDEDRKILSQDSQLIGKVLTVKYQAITDKPDKEGFYSLRFPVVIGVKEDRDFPQETATVRQAKIDFPEHAGVIYKSNGVVEAGFQVTFTDKPLAKLSYIPDKATLADWKSRLFQCKTIQEGTQLIADLRLTIPKIKAFARYLGIRLRGCRYLKAEIVRWVINASLGAKLRADALMKAVHEKQEVQCERLFHDFRGSSYAVKRGSQFVVGGTLAAFGLVSRQRRSIALCGWRPATAGDEGFSQVSGGCVMNKPELLACIRAFRQQVISELDRFEDALLSLGDAQEVQPVQAHSVHQDEWMTVKQTCEYLKISETTFYEYIRQGLLPPGFEVGPKSKRWRMSDIEAWKKAKQIPVCEAPRRRGRPSRVMKIGAFVHAQS